MTHSAVPDRDILRRIIFQLQRPDWHVHSPAAGSAADGKRYAYNSTTDLGADSLAALMDQLDWFHAT